MELGVRRAIRKQHETRQMKMKLTAIKRCFYLAFVRLQPRLKKMILFRSGYHELLILYMIVRTIQADWVL